MCENCDLTLERLPGRIRDNAFTVLSVGSSATARGWAYTIGLVDAYGHPELVIAGLPLNRMVGPLTALARCVAAGDRIDTPGQHGFNGAAIGTVPVHSRHLERGLMARWSWYYDLVGRFDLQLRALQIVLPVGEYCWHHQTEQPDLGSPRHVAFDGLAPRDRGGCGEAAARTRAQSPSRRSRPHGVRRAAPPPTMDDLYRHRRSTRRRR